jgi:hypothetical protein
MGANKHYDQLFTGFEPDNETDQKLAVIMDTLELLKSSVKEPDNFKQKVHEMLYLLFDIASEHRIDLDLEWVRDQEHQYQKDIPVEALHPKFPKLSWDQPEPCQDLNQLPRFGSLHNNYNQVEIEDDFDGRSEARKITELMYLKWYMSLISLKEKNAQLFEDRYIDTKLLPLAI